MRRWLTPTDPVLAAAGGGGAGAGMRIRGSRSGLATLVPHSPLVVGGPCWVGAAASSKIRGGGGRGSGGRGGDTGTATEDAPSPTLLLRRGTRDGRSQPRCCCCSCCCFHSGLEAMRSSVSPTPEPGGSGRAAASRDAGTASNTARRDCAAASTVPREGGECGNNGFVSAAPSTPVPARRPLGEDEKRPLAEGRIMIVRG